MQAIKNQARQGDVYLLRDSPFWPTHQVEPENGRNVLAHGELTGHHHSFPDDGQTAVFQETYATPNRGATYVEVKDGGAVLEHQEHAPIALTPGVYRVLRQRQYTPGMAQRVID